MYHAVTRGPIKSPLTQHTTPGYNYPTHQHTKKRRKHTNTYGRHAAPHTNTYIGSNIYTNFLLSFTQQQPTLNHNYTSHCDYHTHNNTTQHSQTRFRPDHIFDDKRTTPQPLRRQISSRPTQRGPWQQPHTQTNTNRTNISHSPHTHPNTPRQSHTPENKGEVEHEGNVNTNSPIIGLSPKLLPLHTSADPSTPIFSHESLHTPNTMITTTSHKTTIAPLPQKHALLGHTNSTANLDTQCTTPQLQTTPPRSNISSNTTHIPHTQVNNSTPNHPALPLNITCLDNPPHATIGDFPSRGGGGQINKSYHPTT